MNKKWSFEQIIKRAIAANGINDEILLEAGWAEEEYMREFTSRVMSAIEKLTPIAIIGCPECGCKLGVVHLGKEKNV